LFPDPSEIEKSGVNYIDILHAAFTCAALKSQKKTDNLIVFYALLGSACLKAAGKMLVKLTKGIEFKTFGTSQNEYICTKISGGMPC
jgi:hypothetical protein